MKYKRRISTAKTKNRPIVYAHNRQNGNAMKVTYSSYAEVLCFARNAFKGFILGFSRSLWAIALLIVNAAVFAFRKAARGIKQAPMAAVIVLLFILVITNVMNYANMKAKLTTAEWRYDRLLMHTDSVYEAYNIHKTYSRLVKYTHE